MNKTEFTKYCIADALFELMKTKNYHDITTKEVVEKAGFSRMSYYRNFKSMDDVLFYFLDVKFANFYKKKNINFNIENVRQAIPLFLGSLSDPEHQEIDEIFFKQGLEHIIFENNRRQIMKASNKERIFANLFINGGFNEIYYNWMIRGRKESPEEVVKLLQEQIERDLKIMSEESVY